MERDGLLQERAAEFAARATYNYTPEGTIGVVAQATEIELPLDELIGSLDGDKAPVCEVVVHDPNFAQRVRNLDEAGLLEQLQCSILGDGKKRKGKAKK